MRFFLANTGKVIINEHIKDELTSEFDSVRKVIDLFKKFNYNLIGYITFRDWESDWSGTVIFILEENNEEKYVLYDFGSCIFCDELFYDVDVTWKDSPELALQYIFNNHSYTVDELFNELTDQGIIDIYKIKPLKLEETDEFKRYIQKIKKVLS